MKVTTMNSPSYNFSQSHDYPGHMAFLIMISEMTCPLLSDAVTTVNTAAFSYHTLLILLLFVWLQDTVLKLGHMTFLITWWGEMIQQFLNVDMSTIKCPGVPVWQVCLSASRKVDSNMYHKSHANRQVIIRKSQGIFLEHLSIFLKWRVEFFQSDRS